VKARLHRRAGGHAQVPVVHTKSATPCQPASLEPDLLRVRRLRSEGCAVEVMRGYSASPTLLARVRSSPQWRWGNGQNRGITRMLVRLGSGIETTDGRPVGVLHDIEISSKGVAER
jgi:hypothetical protein